MSRPTVAEIDLSALRHNYRTIRSLLPPGTRVLAIVKADAYGHGAVPAARALAAEGAEMFGVATVEEGVELRDGGIAGPIVVLGGVDEPQADEAHAAGLAPILFDFGQIPVFAAVARRRGRPFPVHVKIDTGMGRLGFSRGNARAIAEALARAPELKVAGVMTHLSSADGEGEDDRAFTRAQLEAFREDAGFLRRALGNGTAVHALNSAGLLAFPEGAFDMVRPGITLYGSRPSDTLGAGLGLKPVMRLVTRIESLKEIPSGHPVSYGRRYVADGPRRIAAVPIGYADGYRRDFSNAASMGVCGAMAPVAGRVCMDHTMIDVTGIPGVAVGMEAVVMGPGAMSADDLARLSATIPYEILTQVGRRVSRRVVG